MIACLGSQAWSNDDSQMSDAKQLMKVKSNTSMHQAITVFSHRLDLKMGRSVINLLQCVYLGSGLFVVIFSKAD